MRISSMVLAAAVALACGAAQAQAYRWVDKDGKVRYGDVAPPGVKATRLKGLPAAPAQAAPDKEGKEGKDAPKTPMSEEQAFRKRQIKAKEEEEKAQKAEAAAQEKKVNCTAAQENLRTLQSGRRISSVNAKGETVVLDDTQLKQREEIANDAINKYCN